MLNFRTVKYFGNNLCEECLSRKGLERFFGGLGKFRWLANGFRLGLGKGSAYKIDRIFFDFQKSTKTLLACYFQFTWFSCCFAKLFKILEKRLIGYSQKA